MVTNTEKYVTIVLGVIGILTVLIRIARAWDMTNYEIKGLKNSFNAYLVQHERDHARIEKTIDDHIGKHRRY